MINIIEAIRIITAFMVIFISIFAGINTHQGQFLIPRARRHAVTLRRKLHMFGFTLIACISLAQALYLIIIVDTDLLFVNSITHIAILLVLFVLSFIHITGWWYEGTILTTPLQPDAQERVELVLDLSKQIRHTSINALSILAGFMELMLKDPNIPTEIKIDIESSLSSIDSLTAHLSTLADQIKSLDTRDANTTE